MKTILFFGKMCAVSLVAMSVFAPVVLAVTDGGLGGSLPISDPASVPDVKDSGTWPAKGSGTQYSWKIESPLKAEYNSVDKLIGAVLNAIIMFAAPVIVLMFVYLGFQYVLNAGNANTVEKLHNQFLWTAIGALIILGAKVIQLVLSGTITQLTN